MSFNYPQLGSRLLAEANDTVGATGSALHPNVPAWSGGPARGVFRVGEVELPLRSGATGPGEYLADLPGGPGSGLNAQIPTHVEGHVAGLYHQYGLEYGELFINKAPCSTGAMCRYNLGRILPDGAVLDVHFLNDSGSISTWRFTGGLEKWQVIR